MSGGRWDPQTRIAVVVVGMLVVTIGALSTLQWRSGIGAAALVIGGLLVSLAGVAGGTVFGPREMPSIRVVAAQPAAIEAGHPAIESGHPAIGTGHPAIGAISACGGTADSRSGSADSARRGGRRLAVSGLVTRDGIPGQARPTATLAVDSAGVATPVSVADGIPAPHPVDASGHLAPSPAAVPPEANRAGEAFEAGDTEGAAAALLAQARIIAPNAVAYYEAVRDAVSAAVDGLGLAPISGQLLGPLAIEGLPVAVDIRAGTRFSIAALYETYQYLIKGPTEVASILVIINSGSGADVEAVARLGQTLGRPVIAVAWRIGEAPTRIMEGIAQACSEACGEPAASPGQASPEQASPGQASPGQASPEQASPEQASPGTLPQPRRTRQSGVRPAPIYEDEDSWRHANELHWGGKLQQAEEAYRAIVEARTRALGWDHPRTLTARDQHATVLRDLDRLAEALVECDEVLSARTGLFGADHADTLTSRSHLATVYHQLGDLTRAEAEHRKVLENRIRVLGKQDTETLISRSNLAKVYQDLGELDKSIEEHTTVMNQRAALLGPQHRDTLMSRSLLASALHQASRLEEAEAQHRAVLEGRMRSLGPAHLDTAVSRHRLASVLHDLNLLEEAIAEYQAAREVYTELLGPSSPFARAAASDLALAERALRAARRPARPAEAC